jgi:hypothetical protein
MDNSQLTDNIPQVRHIPLLVHLSGRQMFSKILVHSFRI